MFTARHVSESIDRPPSIVMAIARDPLSLPEWAAGLAAGIRREGDAWIATSPMGEVRVEFRTDIERGILDHDVTMPDGTVVTNAMRVLPNDRGSEVVFTLFQRDGMSDAEFEADAAAVAADLRSLRALCERMAG
jgi:hypothetical protein